MRNLSFSDYVMAVLWALQCANGYASHLESGDMVHVRACFESGATVELCVFDLRHYDFSGCAE